MERSWEGLVNNLTKMGILKSPHVIRALRKVPRYLFLPESEKPYASVDSPLPIGEGQTVSAPHG